MKTRTSKYASFKISRFGRRWLTILAVLVLIAIAVLVLNNNEKSKSSTTESVTSKSSQSSNAVSDKAQGSPSASSTASGQAPKTPYGNFVSSHSAGLNDLEFSTCITSTGAKCKISFSRDGTTKSLDEKNTDADGAAYWTWKPQDLGLTAGSWKISATATANGQTSSADESTVLTISP